MSRPQTPNQGTRERLKDAGREAKKWLKHPIDSFRSRASSPARAAWSFTQLLLKKAPIAVDTNPVKIMFGIAQIALELKKGMQDNMDTTERRIAAVLDLILVVGGAIQNWHGKSPDETRAMEAFEAALSKELDKFFAIQEQSKAHQFLVQEEDKQKIADVFERVNEARQNMILATGFRVHRAVVTIDQKLNKLLREQLKPSYIANHKYYLEGEAAKALRRTICTPGTRRSTLSNFGTWATDPLDSHSLYWLFGPAGAGKSTIAFTITQLFEMGGGRIVLGASFFCSRQFHETRSVSYIVRTIVYQLCLVCKAFADAYHEHGDDSAIDQGPLAQLQGLLIKPWQESCAARKANKDPTFLIGIDALDELEGKGGSEFLTALLKVQGQLQGLKFFITSREDPDLATYSQSFGKGQVCRLQEVSPKEADEDIRTYLLEKLGRIVSRAQVDQLVRDAAGLFIYAATIVEHVIGEKRSLEEQRDQVSNLLTAPASHHGATTALDNLYSQILEEALSDPDEAIFQKRLRILHVVMCTVELTSPSVVNYLLGNSSDHSDNQVTATTSGYQETIGDGAAEDIVRRLHAVLYMQGGQVMWFHKSFPDHMFDATRSTKRFYCDQGYYHCLLAEGCFRTMHQQLCFNIANIPDSSILDRDNPMLQDSIKRNISPALRYTCRSWSQHLIAARLADPVAILQSVRNFLQLQVLFWIETMTLLGQRGWCDGMLREAQKWSILSKNSVDLAKQLGDAAAFALYFSASPAASSTPHLYLSALATFPHTTNLCTTWRTYFQGIPAFTNAIQGTGGSPLMSIKMKSPVKALAVSSVGSCIVTGSEDGMVQVWDLSTRERLKVLQGHDHPVSSVAFSPDGAHIVSGSDDQTVQVWDALTGEQLKVLQGHSNEVNSVAFSPDGTHIASGSDDTTVRVWDALTGEQLKVLRGHSDYVNSVDFSPDGTQIVSGSWDQTVGVWDALTGEQLKVLQGHSNYVNSAVFSPDGTWIISGSSDQTVRVWDALTGKELKILQGHRDWVRSVTFSPDGTQIVSGSKDQTVRVWDASSGEELKVLLGHSSSVSSLAFSMDGARIVSGSWDQTVQVWDAVSGEELKVLKGHSNNVNSVAFSPDGTHIVSGSVDQTVQVWDALTGEQLKVLQGHSDYVNSVDFSPDGTQIVSGSDDQTVRVWDALSGEVLKVLKGHSNWVRSVAFSPDGTCIVSGSDDQTVQVWDALSGEELKILQGHRNLVRSVAFSPDGTQIISGSDDATVRVWDALTGEQLKVLKGHSNWVRSVDFSPDGTHIVSGSYDHTVRVWDALSGEELKILQGHRNWVISVAFSPDGTQIISGLDDATVRVWDALTGEQLKVLKGHSNPVNSVAFSPDGTHIVSGSDDRTVRVWHPPTGTPIDKYAREKTPEDGHTGWLVSPDNSLAYLMFVPPSEHLPDASNILTIPATAASFVDFSKAKLGADWAQCYTPAKGK